MPRPSPQAPFDASMPPAEAKSSSSKKKKQRPSTARASVGMFTVARPASTGTSTRPERHERRSGEGCRPRPASAASLAAMDSEPLLEEMHSEASLWAEAAVAPSEAAESDDVYEVVVQPGGARNVARFVQSSEHQARGVRLVAFEHTPGSKVYEGLFPSFLLPNGRQAHFFDPGARLVEQLEVPAVAPPRGPSTLAAALQVGLPWPLPLLRPLTAPLPQALPPPLIPRPAVCAAPDGEPVLPVHDAHWTPLLHAELRVETLHEKVVDEPVAAAVMRGRGRWRITRSCFSRRAVDFPDWSFGEGGQPAAAACFQQDVALLERKVRFMDWLDKLVSASNKTAEEAAAAPRKWKSELSPPVPTTKDAAWAGLQAVLTAHYETMSLLLLHAASLTAQPGAEFRYVDAECFARCCAECGLTDGPTAMLKKADALTLFAHARDRCVRLSRFRCPPACSACLRLSLTHTPRLSLSLSLSRQARGGRRAVGRAALTRRVDGGSHPAGQRVLWGGGRHVGPRGCHAPPAGVPRGGGARVRAVREAALPRGGALHRAGGPSVRHAHAAAARRVRPRAHAGKTRHAPQRRGAVPRG
jgi:hypothetical protein